MGRRKAPARARLMVDPVSCEAVGLCAQVAPGLIQLDRWGYPVTPTHRLTAAEARTAKRAARGCPRRALAVITDRDDG